MSVFLRPRVSDLVFQVYGKPLHPELFDIVAVRRVEREDYKVTVRITRTGHFITWENGQSVLSELAGEGDAALGDSRKLISQRIRGEQTAAVPLAGGLRYQTSFQVETLTPEVFVHVHDEILSDGARRGLLHNFQPNNRLATAPLGFISLEARPGTLLWSTFHTFPQENAVLKTQSLIEASRESSFRAR